MRRGGSEIWWRLPLALICLACLGAAACTRTDVRGYVQDLSSPNVLVRQEAVGALAEAGDTAAVPHLLVLLDDPVSSIRLATVRALGGLGDKRSREAIVRRLGAEDAMPVRLALIEALGKLHDARAVPDLLRLLDKPLTPNERYTIIWALGNIGDPKAADKLCQLLASRDEYVAYNAAQALRRLK